MPTIDAIDPATLTIDLRKIVESAPLPGLGEQPRCAITGEAIEQWRRSAAEAGTLVEGALWLLAGELDRSHTISQACGSAEGSFLHGIMHRREGDFGNSKYWFRKVPSGHRVYAELVGLVAEQREELSHLPSDRRLEAESFSATLVDLCKQAVTGSEPDCRSDLEKVCWWEWQLLFSHVLNSQHAS